MPTIPTRQRHNRNSKSGFGSTVEIFISVNFIRLKMSSMKLVAIIAESIKIDVIEMKKNRLFFIRTSRIYSFKMCDKAPSSFL
jgi:hypothetical protein